MAGRDFILIRLRRKLRLKQDVANTFRSASLKSDPIIHQLQKFQTQVSNTNFGQVTCILKIQDVFVGKPPHIRQNQCEILKDHPNHNQQYMNILTKTVMSFCILAAGPVLAQSLTIDNPWSGASGDKANLAGFAFKADAGNYPNSITPSGSLSPTFELTSLTLGLVSGDTTTPSFGTSGAQLATADTPVFIDIYTGYSAGTFSGYLGSSSTSVTWNTVSGGTSYTLNFSGIILDSSTKYWFAFSDDNVDGSVKNFRMEVNTSGSDSTAGPGKGYLVGDTAQAISVNNSGGMSTQDWGPAYSISATPVPEPSAAALAALGISSLMIFRRRS